MNSDKLIKEIKSWYPAKELPIHINEPLISNSDLDAVMQTLNDNWVSTAGPIVNEFETSVSKVFDNKGAVAVNSGTSALHMALAGLGISRNDEVITTPLTFVAPLNAINYVGGEPFFIDISLEDLSLDINELNLYAEKYFNDENNNVLDSNTNKKVKALLVVDVFGHIGKIEEYRKFCDKYQLKLIVDSAESLGSKRNNLTSAEFSDVTTASFNGNKIVTSGAGGAVISGDEELLDKVRHLSTTANKTADEFSYFHDSVGYNYRLPALNAALGNSQIKNLNNKVKTYRDIHRSYAALVKNVEEINIFNEVENSESNYWLNLFMFKNNISKDEKNNLISQLNKNGIGARNVWNVLHELPFVNKDSLLNYPNAEFVFNNGFNLPTTIKLLKS